MGRLAHKGFSGATLDYGGSMSGTGHRAEGIVAASTGKGKMPLLFCTFVRTDRVPDIHHRPGNVHDPNGADTFTDHRMGRLRPCLPGTRGRDPH